MSRPFYSILIFALGLLVGCTFMNHRAREPVAINPGVTGIGGVFFKADDPEQLRAWYQHHLGIDAGPQGVNFLWRIPDDSARYGMTVWSLFPRATAYFGPGGQDFMINYRVADLDALLARLRQQGVEQLGTTEEYEYGRFAWILDGEGNRIELWEPVNFTLEEYNRRYRTAD